MPEHQTVERAKKAKREGKSPTTQAGEFVREEFHHIREGKHGARSAKQAIAIGLSKARRAGVELAPPKDGKASKETRRNAQRAVKQAHDNPQHEPSPTRSRATHRALEREGRAAGSHEAIARQTRAAARKRTAAERSSAARKAVRTKGPVERKRAAQKAARTRAQANAPRRKSSIS